MRPFSRSSKRSRGFTLIELLVVVAIIGILASIIMISVGRARGKARDARRKSDVASIQSAVEMLNDDTGKYTVYATANDGWINNRRAPNPASFAEGLVKAGYLSAAPHDPTRPDTSGGYMYVAGNLSNGNPGYCIYAFLEKPRDGSDADTLDDGSVNNTGCRQDFFSAPYNMNYIISGGS